MKCHLVWPRMRQAAARNMSKTLSYHHGPLCCHVPQCPETHRLAHSGGKTDEWLTKGQCENYAEGPGRKIKNIVNKATKCMKTQGEWTKCHDKKAKIRRKSGLLFGHSRQSETDFARNCWLRTGITSDYRLQETLRRAEGRRANGRIG